jgi:hypothetical protein
VACEWDRGESAAPRELNQTATSLLCSLPFLPTAALPLLFFHLLTPLPLLAPLRSVDKIAPLDRREVEPALSPFPSRPRRRARSAFLTQAFFHSTTALLLFHFPPSPPWRARVDFFLRCVAGKEASAFFDGLLVLCLRDLFFAQSPRFFFLSHKFTAVHPVRC